MLAYDGDLMSALSSSHSIGILAWIQQPDGTVLYRFPPIDSGTITIDGTAQVLRSLQMTFVDPAARSLTDIDDVWFTPDDSATGLLAPYGNEVSIWRSTQIRGYQNLLWGGDGFVSPLGVFRFSEDDVSTDESGAVHVAAYDRSRSVSRNRFTKPYVITAGQLTTDAIVALVQDRLPFLDITGSAAVVPADHVTALMTLDAWLDPWSEAQKLATSIGYDVYFGADGRLNVVPADDGSGVQPDPDWFYQEGQGSQLLRLEKKDSDDPGYNGVVAISDNQTLTNPIRGEAWDLNPNSPTYSLGQYGQVPEEFYSPFISSQAGADAAAATRLRKQLGGSESIQIDCIPNPVLEQDDTIWVTCKEQRVDDLFIIDRITFPIHPTDPMRLDCRPWKSVS